MTKMSDSREARREQIEAAMFSLGRILLEIDLVILRLQQAMKHYPATHRLIEPVLAYVTAWRMRIEAAQTTLRWVWDFSNAHHWWSK